MPRSNNGWSLFDAMIEHPGKAPYDVIHPEPITTVESMKSINNHTKQVYPDDRICRTMVFATGGAIDFVSLSPETGDVCDQLNVSELFPNGAISIKLLELPGKREKLTYEHRIIVSSDRGDSPVNQTVSRALGLEWHGNIVIAPYSIAGKRRKKMNNVPWGHASFQLLTLLLKYFITHYKQMETTLLGTAVVQSSDEKDKRALM